MRTTITLPDPLLENAKEAAEQRGITVSEFVADALRALLAQSATPSAKPFRPHTVKGKKLPIHAEFSRAAALEDEDEIDRLFRKRG